VVPGQPARRPSPVALAGRHVRIGPTDPARDAADLYPEVSGPAAERLFAYLFTGPFADEAALRADFAASSASLTTVPLAIREATTGRTVGRASYMRIEPEHRSIEVGSILFSPRLARTPAATEAMYLMARHAFEDLGYRRYEWKCDALNAPSRAAALRLGFRYEGIFSKHMIVKGRSRDTAWFAIVEDEWPRVKGALEAWLDPTNFDAAGEQIARLGALRERL
jgi:RimJ/RimL family protein N-acetyltransferase